GVAKPRAMVDVVGAEARAHQLLEEVGLLVRALRRAEAGERVAVFVPDLPETVGRFLEGDLPRGLLEHLGPVARVDPEVRAFRRALLPDERLRQAVGM